MYLRSVSSPWCAQAWLERAYQYVQDLKLLKEGTAFVRRSRSLRVWTVQGKLKGTAGYEEFSAEFPVIPRSIWYTQIIPAIAQQPALLSQVLAGVIPVELEGIVATAGAVLIPDDFHQAFCTCRTLRCKHIPALFMQAGTLFLGDAFSLIELRGIKRDDFLRRLREEHQKLLKQQQPQDVEVALPVDPQTFWEGAPWTGRLPSFAPSRELLIWRIPLPEFAGGSSFAQSLEYIYQSARGK